MLARTLHLFLSPVHAAAPIVHTCVPLVHTYVWQADFYGYVPNDALRRTASFACLILDSALLLLLRSVGAALLIIANETCFVAYVAGDVVLYLLQKGLCNDGWYWVPIDGAAGVATSIIGRVLVKVITDYTGVVHFRAAWELGVFIGQRSCFWQSSLPSRRCQFTLEISSGQRSTF